MGNVGAVESCHSSIIISPGIDIKETTHAIPTMHSEHQKYSVELLDPKEDTQTWDSSDSPT